ncbi:MAG: 2,3,4,5-tetrahydropyridine-2,6-dicarboxylate N-succinyltransferase [Deltaproteobacteria bacterium]|nr:2,3,4,5-tetrahydropyridine-2,6-dicarboxylate N-succinyltransferase [Deltaproteobacteria bacterium]
MKFKRPAVAIERLKDFFLDYSGNRDDGRRFPAARLRRNAADVLWYLDRGMLRVWDPGTNTVNAWVREAILAYFRAAGAAAMSAGVFEYFDKLPVKPRASLKGVRVVPGAVARFGAFVEEGAILMPSFVNVGARVGKATMVDTWATVGSCAQVGAGVHLSGGVGIGGVLEPAQAAPVIIEDGAFLGSRAIVVEGVRVGREAVLGAGVVLTASTKIVDVRGKEPVVLKGAVPGRAVVIPGTIPKKFPAGEFGTPCALIIGTRTASTDLKTSLNEALRDHGVAV